MLELLGGIIIGGVAGVVLKGKLSGAGAANESKKRELESLYAENEKFSKRNKELERQVEDLLYELKKTRTKFKESDDYKDDLADELATAKNKIKSL